MAIDGKLEHPICFDLRSKTAAAALSFAIARPPLS
jgi:hypothetical protein